MGLSYRFEDIPGFQRPPHLVAFCRVCHEIWLWASHQGQYDKALRRQQHPDRSAFLTNYCADMHRLNSELSEATSRAAVGLTVPEATGLIQLAHDTAVELMRAENPDRVSDFPVPEDGQPAPDPIGRLDRLTDAIGRLMQIATQIATPVDRESMSSPPPPPPPGLAAVPDWVGPLPKSGGWTVVLEVESTTTVNARFESLTTLPPKGSRKAGWSVARESLTPRQRETAERLLRERAERAGKEKRKRHSTR